MWLASDYQARHLAGAAFPDTWTRLTPPPPCPGCGRGYLVDPGGADAGAGSVRNPLLEDPAPRIGPEASAARKSLKDGALSRMMSNNTNPDRISTGILARRRG